MRFRRVVSTSLLMVPMVAVFGTAHAQDAAPVAAVAPRRFGITAGINSSTFGGKDANNPKPARRSGLIAGVLLVAPIGPSFAFQPELLYTMRGANFDDSGTSGSFTMNYVQVPLLARLDIGTSGRVKPSLHGGLALSFKLTCDVEATFSGATIKSSCKDLEGAGGPTIKSFDYGAIIGGGLAFDASGKTVTIGARYDHSLAKLSADSDIKHRVISVLATLEFPLGK